MGESRPIREERQARVNREDTAANITRNSNEIQSFYISFHGRKRFIMFLGIWMNSALTSSLIQSLTRELNHSSHSALPRTYSFIYSEIPLLIQSLNEPLSYSLIHAFSSRFIVLIQSPPHSLSIWCTHPLNSCTHSFIHPLTDSCIQLLSLAHSLTHSLFNAPKNSLTHSLTPTKIHVKIK